MPAYRKEPVARELLQRLLGYATGSQLFRTPAGKLLVSASPSSAMLAKLRHLGVACEPWNMDLPHDVASVWLADASELPADFQPPGPWAATLAGGGTLVIHGARPEQAAWLSTLAGKRVTLTAQPYGMWEGRAFRNGRPWLLPGLSHIDLYWKRYDGSEGAVSKDEKVVVRGALRLAPGSKVVITEGAGTT